jgi:hypothetical protein
MCDATIIGKQLARLDAACDEGAPKTAIFSLPQMLHPGRVFANFSRTSSLVSNLEAQSFTAAADSTGAAGCGGTLE